MMLRKFALINLEFNDDLLSPKEQDINKQYKVEVINKLHPE